MAGAAVSHASDTSGRRLGNAVLLYLATAVAVITLAPFQFELRPVHGLTGRWGAFDIVMNVVMFVPVGFVYALSRARERRRAGSFVAGALVVGAVLSGVVELAQVFAPARFPSLFDLASNTVGSLVGAWLASAAMEAARARGDATETVRTLAVDLPLMGLTYLLVPLVWLAALGADHPQRISALVPLAMAAAWVIASVFRSFEDARRSRITLVTAAWLLVALLPSFVQRPGPTSTIGLIALATAWLRTVAPARFTHEAVDGRPSRRFEAATLRMVAPMFFMYLALSAATPWMAPMEAWSGALGLVPNGQDIADPDIYRALEQIAAFTLLGYAVAEYHGRSRDGLRELVTRVLVWTAVASAVLQAIRGWHPEHGASGLLFALTILGAIGGTWIYVLQLEHVRALASRPSGGPGA